MIVIDASALVAYLLGEEDLEHYLHEDLYSLDLAIKEAANALLTAFRQGRINEASMTTCYSALMRLAGVMEFKPQLAIMDKAFALASREDLTVYDSLYVELAKEMNARLLTLDQRQRKVAEKEKIIAVP